MNRDQFLKDAWNPYPPAKSGWQDVSTFLETKGREGLVCGRLALRVSSGVSLASSSSADPSRSPDLSSNSGSLTWVLQSNGAELNFRFAPVSPEADSVGWLEPQRAECDFQESLLSEGDLVCLRLVREGSDRGQGQVFDSGHVAKGVLLLAPGHRPVPRSSNFDVSRSRQWTEFLAETRSFFRAQDFIEALTPTLVPSPGTEPFLDPFSTEWHFGSLQREFFLPTSPEFHLKKMLVEGWTKIFEFKTCFRNGEISEHHQPEFLMLEWYRAYSSLDAIADDVEELIARLAKRFFPGENGPQLRRVTMAELFVEAFPGFRLEPETTRDELLEVARAMGIQTAATDTWDDVFFRLFLEKIEPGLGKEGPLLVRGYPPSQAALSRIGGDGFADRFEVYWQGLELANAFHELSDPRENEARFRIDARRKAELGKRPVPVDEELVGALYAGMPPSGGIALGLDRLFMALFKIDRISDTRAFPVRVT